MEFNAERHGEEGVEAVEGIIWDSQNNQNHHRTFYSMNVRSVRNKSTVIHDFICDTNVDLISNTETWLTENDSAVQQEFVPLGYKFVHQPRNNRRGGGTGLVFKETINVSQTAAGEKNSFEYAEYHITNKSYQLCLINIYRPPYSESHPVSVSSFLSEFNDYIQNHLLSNLPVLVTGDFNIHVDVSGDSHSFLDLLESLCCTQLVDFCTHTHGHTLDLLIRRQSDDTIVIGKPWAHSTLISDHFPVMCYLNLSKVNFPIKKISFRRLSAINTDLLKEDIVESRLCKEKPNDISELATVYDTTLKEVIDKHAPMVVKTVVLRPKVPWLTDAILEEKRKKRKAEKRWLKSRIDKDWKDYKSARNSYSFLLYEARKAHHKVLVSENKENPKALFNIVKGLLNMSNKQPVMPCNVGRKTFVNNLGNYFLDKVQKFHDDIESKLSKVNKLIIDETSRDKQIVVLKFFKELSEQDVKNLIMKLSKKSCPLDPMPTKLLMQCLDVLLPVITSMINVSLSIGQFPVLWKVALVKPLLK